MTSIQFADDLMQQVRAKKNALCVGLDPHLAHIPKCFRQGSLQPGDKTTHQAVEAFTNTVLERIADKVAVVKPQISFFELLGPKGLEILDTLCRRAKQLGVRVILDAKRGDIGSTCDAYAEVYLGKDAPYDALTVNPYMGLESLTPFVQRCIENDKGLFVLVKTSNPGSKEFQELEIDGKPLYQYVANELNRLVEKHLNPSQQWSNFGAVVGATYPEQAASLRQMLPQSLFLIPGYGAQGGSLADAVCGLVRQDQALSGGIVNSSRGVLFPSQIAEASAKDWETGFDANLHSVCLEFAEYFQ